MNFLGSLKTSSIKCSLWIKSIGSGLLFILIFFGQVKAQTFNTPGPITFTVPNFSGSLDPGDLVIVDIDLIIVGAGGGGGRGNGAGGGGGGQVIQRTISANEGDILTGFIGTGGAGRTGSDGSGSNGNATTFNGISATGGFGGGGGNAGFGGASGSGQLGGNGNAISSPDRQSGGGGGGASGAGTNGFVNSSSSNGGNGGSGILVYGGGGGGTRNGGGGGSSEGSGSAGGTSGSSNGIATNGGGGGGGRTEGGRGGDGVVVVSVNFRVLPVEFLYFRSAFNSSLRSGYLTWSTAKEWENSHFEIQRSVNEVKSWEKIGEIQGAGYSDLPVEYAYQDLKLPLSGGDIYYRLKQVDINGKFSYSDIKAIQVNPIAGTTSWRVYPNPTTGESINVAMLEKATSTDQNVLIRIISTNGQFDVIEGSSSSELSWQLSDLLKHKTSGIYALEISWGKNREYHKVILNR